MLNLGCRYFDFRPGYAVSPVNSVATGIYHQHTVGYPFLSFLTDVLNWLDHNPTEIVVAGINSQGFRNASMVPSADTLAGLLVQAQQATRSNVAIGTAGDLVTSYADLISANKRLFFLDQIGSWYPAWLVTNVGSKVAAQPQLVVLLNDFVDNALAQTASTGTAQRVGA